MVRILFRFLSGAEYNALTLALSRFAVEGTRVERFDRGGSFGYQKKVRIAPMTLCRSSIS